VIDHIAVQRFLRQALDLSVKEIISIIDLQVQHRHLFHKYLLDLVVDGLALLRIHD